MTLPRKDTKKRFKKLLKDSGKSKTNTDYGATDTSKKKISTYEKVMTFDEYIKEALINKIVIGVDVDGTINDFHTAYNIIYKRYFPDSDVFEPDDWYWYKKMDYNGLSDIEKQKWFKNAKAETFDISKPYANAVTTINNIYDFIKSHGHTLNIVTNQVTQEAKDKVKIWLDEYGFKYDDLIFVDAAKDKWKFADIMIDDAEKVINNKPLSKVSIKIDKKWNEGIMGDFNIPNIDSLTIQLIQTAISKFEDKNTI